MTMIILDVFVAACATLAVAAMTLLLAFAFKNLFKKGQ